MWTPPLLLQRPIVLFVAATGLVSVVGGAFVAPSSTETASSFLFPRADTPSWSIQHRRTCRNLFDDEDSDTDSSSGSSSSNGWKQGLEIPLLDLSSWNDKDEDDDDDDDKTGRRQMIQALPGSHLPDVLSASLNLYVMEMALPIHKTIVEAAMERGDYSLDDGPIQHCFGQVVSKPNEDDWVGAIGCVVQVLSPSLESLANDSGDDQDKPTEYAQDLLSSSPQSVLCRGLYRFVVREIKQTVPFVVAVVEELPDSLDSTDDKDGLVAQRFQDDDDDDDDDDDMFDDYTSLTPRELEQRLMQALSEYVDQQLAVVDERQQTMSPLERSLMEGGNGGGNNVNIQQEAAEETAALLQVFQGYVVDELSMVPANERWFALAFFAAELAELKAGIRRTMLEVTDSVERLRLVTQHVEETVRMGRARRMAKAVTDQTDEMQRDLQVGRPQLPPKSVFGKGTEVEYFWNEEYEWCQGVVVEDPELIVDDRTGEEYMLMTVTFEDDGSTHKIPFRPEEKARWRPTRGRS